MSSFLNNIVTRHTNAASQVQPRLPGRFETHARHSNHESENLSVPDEYIATPSPAPGQPVALKRQHDLPNIVADAEPGDNITSAGNILNPQPMRHNDRATTSHLYPSPSQTIAAGNENAEGLVQDPGYPDRASPGQFYNTQELNVPGRQKTAGQQQENNAFTEKEAADGFLHHYGQSNYLLNISPVAKEFTAPVIQAGTAQSVIKVSIGRIDVRATTTATPVKQNSIPAKTNRMSLDDYFNKKKNV